GLVHQKPPIEIRLWGIVLLVRQPIDDQCGSAITCPKPLSVALLRITFLDCEYSGWIVNRRAGARASIDRPLFPTAVPIGLRHCRQRTPGEKQDRKPYCCLGGHSHDRLLRSFLS